MSPVSMLFKQFPYQLTNKEYLITVFKIWPFFVLPVHFWAFWWKRRGPTANGCKMTVHQTLCIFSDHSVQYPSDISCAKHTLQSLQRIAT